MPHELIDESRGPGVPAGSAVTLQEVWSALGFHDGRTPTLDEVLIEIRNLRQAPTASIPPMPEEQEQVEYVPQSALALPSVSYADFGITVIGFSADDTIKIRKAYLEEGERP